MNIALAAAAAAKSQGRFNEYDHISEGDPGRNHEKPKNSLLTEMPFEISEIILYPTNSASSDCFQFCWNNGKPRTIWRIARVADLNTLHLYTVKEKTRCELWARMWSTSRIFAEVLLGNNVCSQLFDLTILEIGAGTAVCGMIAAAYGAKVTVTDSSEQALTLATKTASINQIQMDCFETKRLDWHSEQSISEQCKCDVLVGSDVLFMEMNLQSVINVVMKCVKPGGFAIILDPGRPCAENFAGLCKDTNLLFVEAMEIRDLIVGEGRLMKRVVLYLVEVGNWNGTVGEGMSKAKRKQVLEVIEGFRDTWQFMKEYKTAETDEKRTNMTYEYTENFQ